MKAIIALIFPRASDILISLIAKVILMLLILIIVFLFKSITTSKEMKSKRSAAIKKDDKVGILMLVTSILSIVVMFPLKYILLFVNAPTEVDSITGILCLIVIPFLISPSIDRIIKKR